MELESGNTRLEERRAYIEKQYGVVVSDDVAQTVKTCKVLVLAVKPQDLDALLAGVKGRLTEKHLLVSIVAGKTLATLKKAAGAKPRLVRGSSFAKAAAFRLRASIDLQMSLSVLLS